MASFKDWFPQMFGCLSQVQSKTPKQSPASCNCMLENINEIVTYREYRHHESPIYSLGKIPVSSKIAKSKHAPVICGDIQNKK